MVKATTKAAFVKIDVTSACLGLLVAGGVLMPSPRAMAEEEAGSEVSKSSEVTSDQSQVETLPPLLVEDTKVYGSQSLRGATLSKMPLEMREIPQSVSVIDRQRMEQQNLTDLDDVMEKATGVTVQPYQQLTTQYYVRGFQADSFEIDGSPVGIGYQASSPQDMAVYDRVEILRGSNGMLHGSGNPAATINLVRKKPTDTFQSSVDLSGGSWDTYRGEADLGGPLIENGAVRGRLVGAYEKKGYFYDEAEQKTGLAYGVIEADLSDTTLLTLGGQYQAIDAVPNIAGVPMAADGSDLGLSRSRYLNTDWSANDWRTVRAFGALEHQWGGGWTSKLSLEYEKSSSDLKYGALYGSNIDAETGNGAILMPGAYRFHDENRSVDLHANGPFKLLGKDHHALFGLNSNRRQHKVDTGTFETNIARPVNVYTWDPSSVPEPGVSRYDTTSDSDTREAGFYAMGRFSIADPLTLVLGSRFSGWQQDTLTSSYSTGLQWIPYSGLIWDFADDWSAYAGYTSVFQPQTSLTYDGGILDPIEGRSYEVGIKGALYEDRLNVSAALFRIEQSNRAVEDPDHPSVGRTTYYINGGKVRSQGVELEVNGKVMPDWDVSAGYTYTDTKYLEDPNNQGDEFSTTTPHHMFKLWTNYTLPWEEKRWSVGAGLNAQSEITKTSNSITMKQSPYVTMDLRLAYRIMPTVTASLNVKNISNEKYYQELFSPNWSNRYGEPRSVTFGVRATF
ncbi:TonB-dependent siderophore receptor [Rhodospirillum rubrum]|nr:TonB-dependent siderophore receptor [Rhodospirillum rubrum]QXG81312.1 TonB-dependent siderophore receptor [Rhodospirillum rubrum]